MEPQKIDNYASTKEVIGRVLQDPFAHAGSYFSPQEKKKFEESQNFWGTREVLSFALGLVMLSEILNSMILALIIGMIIYLRINVLRLKFETSLIEQYSEPVHTYVRERAWGLGVDTDVLKRELARLESIVHFWKHDETDPTSAERRQEMDAEITFIRGVLGILEK